MKITVPIIILITFVLINCKSKKQFQTEYEPTSEISALMEGNEENYWDTLCTVETKRAEIDIKKNKLVYTHLFGMVKRYRSDTEMDSLLAKYSISTTQSGFLCTAPLETQNCYRKEMNKEISKRYGIKFIDSLRQVAEKIYIYKHRNDIFRFEECDRTSRYPGTDDYGEFFDNYKRDFFTDFKYPKEYKYKNEKYFSYSNVYFTIWKDGRISDLKIESTFQNRLNKKFRIEIEKQIEEFVQKVKWKPATALGTRVNSEMRLTIHYK